MIGILEFMPWGARCDDISPPGQRDLHGERLSDLSRRFSGRSLGKDQGFKRADFGKDICAPVHPPVRKKARPDERSAAGEVEWGQADVHENSMLQPM